MNFDVNYQNQLRPEGQFHQHFIFFIDYYSAPRYTIQILNLRADFIPADPKSAKRN